MRNTADCPERLPGLWSPAAPAPPAPAGCAGRGRPGRRSRDTCRCGPARAATSTRRGPRLPAGGPTCGRGAGGTPKGAHNDRRVKQYSSGLLGNIARKKENGGNGDGKPTPSRITLRITNALAHMCSNKGVFFKTGQRRTTPCDSCAL